jgi:hypothetical protein
MWADRTAAHGALNQDVYFIGDNVASDGRMCFLPYEDKFSMLTCFMTTRSNYLCETPASTGRLKYQEERPIISLGLNYTHEDHNGLQGGREQLREGQSPARTTNNAQHQASDTMSNHQQEFHAAIIQCPTGHYTLEFLAIDGGSYCWSEHSSFNTAWGQMIAPPNFQMLKTVMRWLTLPKLSCRLYIEMMRFQTLREVGKVQPLKATMKTE